jgi:DME family drug/metabolite transporter
VLRARLEILSAAVLWSTAGAAIKLSGLSGWQIAGGRSLVAGLFIFALFPESRRLPGWRALLVSASYAATVVFFVLATKLTTAANAIFIQDMAPLWVLLLSPRLLGEKPTAGELLAVPVYGLGLGLFFLDELSAGQRAGNLVALASGVAFAFCIVGLRRVKGAGNSVIAWGNLLAFAVVLPAWPLGPAPRALDVGLLVYLGIFQLGLSYVLFNKGLHGTPAVEAAFLALLEPVLNPIWTFLFTGERPGPWAIAGGSIVLVATTWRILQPALIAPRAGIR